MRISTAVGVVTKNMGILGIATTNSGVEFSDAYFRKGEDALTAAKAGGISFGVSAVGGVLGKTVEKSSSGYFNPAWKKYEEKAGHLPYGIS
ncbi:hypothetical protein, partial [Conservatibacter flavescens]